MRSWILAGLVCGWVLGVATMAGAQQTYKWTEVFADGELPEGAAVSEARETLVVTGISGTPTTVRLLTIDDPVLESMNYGLSGRVAYQEVEGEAYLEMWNVFTDGSRYFTRTLSARGPMGKLMGSHAGREYVLPFNRSGASGPPVRLEVNLVLPGAGTVEFEDATLHDKPMMRSGAGSSRWGWMMGCLFGGIGVVVGLVATLRRRSGDRTEARKMKAMDV